MELMQQWEEIVQIASTLNLPDDSDELVCTFTGYGIASTISYSSTDIAFGALHRVR